MLGPRTVNEFDNFISNQNKSPRQNLNNNFFTQIEKNYHTHNNIQYLSSSFRLPNQYQNNRNNKSPSRVVRKNINNKKKQYISTDNYCSNEGHQNKVAQCMINIDGQNMYYCGICGVQAASQGFKVIMFKKTKVLPHYPQYSKNDRYQQLLQLMQNIIKIENQAKKYNIKQVEQHYYIQQQILNQFYDKLINIVNEMRVDHLKDLQQQHNEKIQNLGPVMSGMKQKIRQINQYWEDIDDNFQLIMKQLDQGNYQTTIKEYKKKLNNINSQVATIQKQIQQFTKYTPNDLKKGTKLFQDLLSEIWNIEESHKNHHQNVPKQNNQAKISVKTVHDMLPKLKDTYHGPKQKSANGAFRNLFPQQSLESFQQTSPQFKPF